MAPASLPGQSPAPKIPRVPSAESASKQTEAAEKAKAAQQAAEKAAVAQKSAEKTTAAQKTVEKASAASPATEKAATRQATIEKLNAAKTAADKAEAAKKSSDAATKSAEKTPRAPKEPASAKSGGVATNVVPEKAAEWKAAGEIVRIRALGEVADSKATKGASGDDTSPDEARRIVKDAAREDLSNLDVPPDVANKLADDLVDPEKAPAARDRVKEISGSSADLQLVSVSDEKRKEIVDAVSRSDDPKGTANEKVGEAATEEVFGKDVAAKVPQEKRKNFRDVFRNLADLKGSLEEIGGDPDDPEFVEAINEGAERGITTKEEAREILERAGQKVLDRQGFSPAKDGESLKDRLDRIAKEQEAEVAARKAQAAARLAKAKVRAAITPGASGSTAAGRSVSARLEVAIGGGKGATSGAGSAAHGTGTDASKTTGSGGSFRSDAINVRLPADKGGTSTAGQVTTGRVDGKAPGAAAPAVTSPATAPSALEPGTGVESTQPPATTPAPGATTATDGGAPAGGSATVTSPGDEVVIGGGQGSTFGGHLQSEDGNTGGDLTFKPDGTFSGTVTTVTRDASGNITSTTQTEVVGTWGKDADGNVVVTSATVAPSSGGTTTTTSTESSGGGGEGEDKDGKGDDDDDDDDNDDDPPPAATSETSSEEAPAETAAETTAAAGSTPNPLDEIGGNPMELSNRTGGRLGGDQAKRQKRGLDLAGSGGGAGGPNPDGRSTGPSLLTPEEQANAARLLGMKRGGGVTTPNPMNEDAPSVTDRDLKELNLRGKGGAKGPTESTGPAQPQDPKSPVGGAPVPSPVPGNRVNSAVAPAARVDAQRIKIDPQIKESVR